jgi:hypothetical protein
MWFSLDVLRARKGDCLILHFGSAKDPHLVMIDGGPSNVYHPHLKRRLEQLREARRLEEHEPLPADVLMVSHVDDDHIKGILDLTKELRELKQEKSPLFLRVGSLWHNSFDDILKTAPEELEAEAGFGAAALAGNIEVADDEELDVAKVLASIPQGRDLRLDARFLNWPINDKFKGKLILATGKAKPVPLEAGLKLTVVGPMRPELEALQAEHDRWVRERKKMKPPKAALAAFADKSIPNLSSIVVLVEAKGKKMLLTGDARGDKILEGLQLVGLLGPNDDSTMHVDLLKVPHHGSANNLEPVFFKRITANHYVFSGNGEHGNPERESLEMLLEARGDAPLTMHFTYPIDEIDVERKKDWNKERAKEKARKKKVREAWSAKKHGLAAFFKDHKVPAQKISIVEDGQAHVIDLLDEFGF